MTTPDAGARSPHAPRPWSAADSFDESQPITMSVRTGLAASARGAVWLLVFAVALTGCEGGTAEEQTVELAPTPTGKPDDGGLQDQASGVGGELRVHFLDIGQGDATLLVAPDATVLVDTGRHDRSDVTDHLERLGVDRLDVLAVSHPHADHLGGFPSLMEAVEVGEVWWSGAEHTTLTFERALDALEASDAGYEEPRAGDTTAVGSLHFEFANPGEDADFDDLHDSSLAFRVTYGEVHFLFTGDAEEHTEAGMVERHGGLLATEIYQVGHHGSTTSTSPALLDATRPEVAIWSAGQGNRYGHPHGEVIQRLEAAGTQVYGTATDGTVTVVTDGATYTIETEHGSPTGSVQPDPPATAPPGDAGSAVPLAFTSVTSPVAAGGEATASVATAPGAQCAITVTYSGGPSQAQGLQPKTAGDDGKVSWTWPVGTRTTPGQWPVDVSCTAGDQTASARELLTVQ